MAADPQGSVAQLKGIGPKLQQTLERLGIYRLMDLLIHLPADTKIAPRSHRWRTAGGEEAFVQGEILGSKIAFGRTRSLEVLISDGQRDLRLRFFHFNKASSAIWKPENTYGPLATWPLSDGIWPWPILNTDIRWTAAAAKTRADSCLSHHPRVVRQDCVTYLPLQQISWPPGRARPLKNCLSAQPMT